MKRRVQKGLLVLSLLGLVASCSTTNDVASNRGIQKRKYTKGFFIDFNHNKGGNGQEIDNIAKDQGEAKEEVVFAEETPLVRSIDQEVVYVEEVQVLPSTQSAVETTEIDAITTKSTTTSSDKSEFKTVEIEEEQALSIPSKLIKNEKKSLKRKVVSLEKESDGDAILYYILAIFIPFLAVGLVTNWDVKQVVINIILCCLCGLPGIIHALIVVSKNV